MVIHLEIRLPGVVNTAGVARVIVHQTGPVRIGIQVDQRLSSRVEALWRNSVSGKGLANISAQRQRIVNDVWMARKVAAAHRGQWYRADKSLRLTAAIELNRTEEKRLIAPCIVCARYCDRSSQGASELVQHEMRVRAGSGEEIPGVKLRVPVEFKKRTVEVSPSRLQNDIGKPSCRAAELSVSGAGLHLELLDGVHRREDRRS